MAAQTPKALLLDLHWPRGDLDQRGTLSWSRALDDVTIGTAAVVVTEKMLTLRYRLMSIGRGVATPLEAKWSVDDGPHVRFIALKENGQVRPLDEAHALKQFKAFAQLLGGEPVFQRHGTRETAVDMVFPNF